MDFKNIELDLLDSSAIEDTLKEIQKLYLNSFANITTYDLYIESLEGDKKEAKNKDLIKQLENAIENKKQEKLATIKMLESHKRNIIALKTLIK